MRIRRLLSVLGLASMLAAGLMFFGSRTASASGGVCNPGCEANVEFTSHGEIFTVHDYDADHHSAVGIITFTAADGFEETWEVWNTNTYDGPPEVQNFSIPEGNDVDYQACKGDSDTGEIWDCSSWYDDEA